MKCVLCLFIRQHSYSNVIKVTNRSKSNNYEKCLKKLSAYSFGRWAIELRLNTYEMRLN